MIDRLRSGVGISRSGTSSGRTTSSASVVDAQVQVRKEELARMLLCLDEESLVWVLDSVYAARPLLSPVKWAKAAANAGYSAHNKDGDVSPAPSLGSLQPTSVNSVNDIVSDPRRGSVLGYVKDMAPHISAYPGVHHPGISQDFNHADVPSYPSTPRGSTTTDQNSLLPLQRISEVGPHARDSNVSNATVSNASSRSHTGGGSSPFSPTSPASRGGGGQMAAYAEGAAASNTGRADSKGQLSNASSTRSSTRSSMLKPPPRAYEDAFLAGAKRSGPEEHTNLR